MQVSRVSGGLIVSRGEPCEPSAGVTRGRQSHERAPQDFYSTCRHFPPIAAAPIVMGKCAIGAIGIRTLVRVARGQE